MTKNKTSNHVGATSEAAVEFDLLNHGYRVLKPMVISRYDLGVDSPIGFVRVQVKTGRRVQSNGLRVTWDGTYDPTEIDIVAVYDPLSGMAFYVPIKDVPDGAAGFTLRLPVEIRPSSVRRHDRRALDAGLYMLFADAVTETAVAI